MPTWVNQNGTPVEIDPYINQNGNQQECNVYVNMGGEPVQVSTVAAMLENFEDGNLDSYVIPEGSHSGEEEITTNAISGNYSLHQWGFGNIQTLPGMGAPGYIQKGREIQFAVNLNTISPDHEQYWFIFCPQHTDTRDDRYHFEFIMDGTIRFRYDINGQRDVMEGTGSGGAANASDFAVNWDANEIYYGRLLIREDGPYAEVYNSDMDNLGWISGNHNQLVQEVNGYGFRSSENGDWRVDDIKEVAN